MKLSNYMGTIFFLIYAAFFMGVFIAIVWWDRRKRKTRPPLGEDVTLMRMPGEYLWRRVNDNDRTETEWMVGLTVLAMIIGFAALQVAAFFLGKSTPAIVVWMMVFAFSTLWCARVLQKRLQRRNNDYLGFFGERFVAECLEPLKSKGWFIFHDIQCDGATGKFNLDHVAVGPDGIWVVETKTWRKGRARPGSREHEVQFDGTKIIWPWCEDTGSIKQAANCSDWLKKWLNERTGRTFEIFAVVALPGYFVTEKKLGPIRVANPKTLPQVLVGQGETVLDPGEIDLIRRQLEAKCRDVEY